MPFEMPAKVHIPPSGVKAPPPSRQYDPILDPIRQQLKQQIDELPEEKLKLLSYRLRLAEINKDIDNLEQDIKNLVTKTKELQNER